jgi:hypothetical protein
MRKLLLASVATLGTGGGFVSAALAQAPVGAWGQGQTAYPMAPSPPTGANNNNNYQAPALPGPVANPTPGTIVIHVNGRVQVDFTANWSSADQRFFTAPAGSPGGATIAPGAATPASTVQGVNGTGVAKVQPESILTLARLWFGADAMATNGLRYGASFEIRQNNTGFQASTSSSGASGYSSLQTLFVRRAFMYVAGENWGIVRVGEGDGPISIFDNGVTTFQFLPTGNLGGGDLQNWPQNVTPALVASAQQGAEYVPAKVVYLSPQIAGFDFGLSYAPSPANGYGVVTSAGGVGSTLFGANGTGLTCGTATSGCPTLSSGPGATDGARWRNAVEAGVRYQGAFGGLGVLAYAVYMGSGTVNYTGQVARTTVGGPATGPGAANLGVSAASFGGGATGAAFSTATRYTGNYQPLSLGSGGIALTYAGFTVGGNLIGGADNGQLAEMPKGGAPLFGYILGAKYVKGPFTIGITGEEWWDQGTVQLAGISQRRGRGISTGLAYAIAPGFTAYTEYQWVDQTQNGQNLITGALGSNANNNIRGQGFLVGSVVNF